MDKRLDEQHYLWLMRAFSVFAAVSALLAVVLVVTFLTIEPRHRWDAFFVAFRNDDARTMFIRRVNDKTIAPGTVAHDIASNLIAYYAVARETLNFDHTSEVFLMSSPEVRDQMMAEARPVGVVLSAVIPPGGVQFFSHLNLWEVDVMVTRTHQNGNVDHTRRRIEVRAHFDQALPGQNFERSGPNLWLNPLGFRITSYRVMGDV